MVANPVGSVTFFVGTLVEEKKQKDWNGCNQNP